jgi:hypothetical protein
MSLLGYLGGISGRILKEYWGILGFVYFALAGAHMDLWFFRKKTCCDQNIKRSVFLPSTRSQKTSNIYKKMMVAPSSHGPVSIARCKQQAFFVGLGMRDIFLNRQNWVRWAHPLPRMIMTSVIVSLVVNMEVTAVTVMVPVSLLGR